MLNHIRLQRFKKFQDVEVYLRPFTVLMGENSSGKTTVIQAISVALNSLFTHNFIYTDTKNKLKIRDKGIGSTTLPGVNFSDYRELYYAKISRGGTQKGAGGANIEIIDTKQNIYRLQIRSLFGAFNIKCISTLTDLSNSPTLHLKPPILISGFVGLQLSEERAFPVAIQDRLRSGEVSSIIRNLLLDTKKKSPDKFNNLKARLEKDFSFYLDDISFDENQNLHVTASYSDLCGTNSVSLDFNSSGSGFMQVLQILAPIYRFCPEESSIVLLDEPDAHLHPNLQSSLANTLRDIQKELEIQIIISTHSTSIIRAADPSEVVPVSSTLQVNKPLSNSDDVEQQISTKIDNYELGKSVLSGKLVFMEDRDISIIKAFDSVLGTKCFSGANTVPVLPGRGKDDKVPFQMNEILNKFVGREVEIHFVRDGDGLTTEWREFLFNYAGRYNVELHQLQRHEIENYLLCPKLIFRALEIKHPNVKVPSENEIEEKLKTLLKNTILLNKYSLDDNLEDSIYKTARLLGLEDYRNPTVCKSKAKELRQIYENYDELDELLKVGMGKEVLKELRSWINQELKLSFSNNDIFNSLESSDIPDEIRQILEQLKSKEAKSAPTDAPRIVEQENADDENDEEEA